MLMKLLLSLNTLSFILSEQELEISYTQNPDVKKIQQTLVDKNYYIGKFGKNKDGVDGKYGPLTKAAHEAMKKGISPEEFNKNVTKFSEKHIGDVSETVLKNEFNFDIIPDGKNNYRSAQIPVKIDGKNFLSDVIDKYKIKTIIRLNGDGKDSRHRSSHPETPIEEERKLAESKGVKFEKLSATKDQEKVNSILSQGNTLIHCAHGQDRTGGNVGGYLHDNGWSTEKVWDYTTKYNSWKSMVKNNPDYFTNGGFLRQAKKFGVKDLQHAKQLK